MSCVSDRMNFLVSNDPAAARSLSRCRIGRPERLSWMHPLQAMVRCQALWTAPLISSVFWDRISAFAVAEICRQSRVSAHARASPMLSSIAFHHPHLTNARNSSYCVNCIREDTLALSWLRRRHLRRSEVPVNTETTNIRCVRKKERDYDCNRQ